MGETGRHDIAWDQPGGRRRLTALVKRSFSLAGHRTSVALEAEFWSALTELARGRGITLSALVAATDAARDPARPLASALRVHALLNSAKGQGAPPPAAAPEV